MKRLLVVLAALLTAFVAKAQAQQLPMLHMSGLLGLVETIPLPGDGYMDVWRSMSKASAYLSAGRPPRA